MHTLDQDTITNLKAAGAGDQVAFNRLVEPYRNELISHCYRMVGSLHDAEDLVQETLLRAWRKLETFEGRASFRAWLYKIATNASLDFLRKRSRRFLPPAYREASAPDEPMLPPDSRPIWLEPFPDELLESSDIGPEARYEEKESITLAFLTALQLLPPRQRSALLFCDVLNWRVGEVAALLETTVSAINSMLYRARSSLSHEYSSENYRKAKINRNSEATRKLLNRYVNAWETADVDTLVALLKEDATFPMPPLPLWYQGRKAIRSFILAAILAGDASGRWRLLAVQSNGQPAFAWYLRDETEGKYHAYAIQILTIEDGLFSDITTFGNPELFPIFGLNAELDG